jgi:enolase-phosphatase E1
MTSIRYILCDVEGTTTDIRFVHQKLFPYASEHLESFYKENPFELQKSAKEFGVEVTSVLSHARNLISNDIKDSELKRVQGLIWKTGYEKGTLQGHVYDDVLPAFRRWKEQGIRLGIYSSGSVQAQKLIYRYSVAGDLTVFLDEHFDLGVGYKYETQSYTKIVETLHLPALHILFLSDIEKELDCARSAGMKTIRIFRDASEQSTHDFRCDFSNILP